MREMVCRKMAMAITPFWFCIAAAILFLFRFILNLFRIKGEDISRKGSPDSLQAEEQGPLEQVIDATKLREVDYGTHQENKEETSSFEFKFKFQFPEDCKKSTEEANMSTAANVSQYRFLFGKDFSGFVEEPQAVTLCVQESYLDSNGGVSNNTDMSLQVKEFQKLSSVSEAVHDEVMHKDCHVDTLCTAAVSKCEEEHPDVTLLRGRELSTGVCFLSENDEEFGGSDFDSSESLSVSDGYSVKSLIIDIESDDSMSDREFDGPEQLPIFFEKGVDLDEANVELLKKSHESGESNLKSVGIHYTDCDYSTDQLFCPKNPVRSCSNMSNEIFPESGVSEPEQFAEESRESNQVVQVSHLQNSHLSVNESTQLTEVESLEGEEMETDGIGMAKEQQFTSSSELDEGHINLEDSDLSCQDQSALKHGNSNEMDAEELVNTNSIDGIPELEDTSDQKAGDFYGKETTVQEDLSDFEENKFAESPNLDKEEQNELESLWEHQDLIEQLRMELRKVREIGLPTIFEESESPKSIEDLKTWKIDAEFLHEDPMDELNKLYKSYREKMRKFDILNYQKMYAIGFLQLRDPLQSMGSPKPTITSLLSQNFWQQVRRKSNTDPSEKLIKDLQSDLEMVYVGQICLSWEILRWQYEKSHKLSNSDPYVTGQYNQVAGEFQQFQVVMQRFLENEPFQGTRVQNYVKSRCVLQNLLQVPVIKEDCSKEKMEELRKGSNVVTSEKLEYIMEKSIRIFWEFVKADKDDTSTIVKGLIGTPIEPQDPRDFDLIVDVQADLHKKEKKLKDILRAGNCLMKKIMKNQEYRSNQDLFFTQVDLKLISRVLKMSRITTDQLLWCQKKLSKINFVERKLYREPSFYLFPC